MSETSVPEGEIVRQPVKPEAIEAKKDKIGRKTGISKGGDPAATVQGTEAQGVAVPQGESVTGIFATGEELKMASAPGSKEGGEALGRAPEGTDEPDTTRLNFTYEADIPGQGGKRRVSVLVNLDELVLRLQGELKALLQAREKMTWSERVLTMPTVTELTEALATMQDQRKAHRLIEKYFEEIAANPAHAQKLPGMSAFKKVAGGMANAMKAAKSDGRGQAEKGKRKADDLLDGLGDAPAAQG